MHKIYSLRKHLLSNKASNQGGFTLIEIMIVIAIIAIMAAYGIPAYLTKVERARGMETAGFFKEIREAQIAFKASRGGYYPLDNDDAVADETNIGRALGLIFEDSRNFAFRIQEGTDATCGAWLQIEAVPIDGGAAANITNMQNRNSSNDDWTAGKVANGQVVLFQVPIPVINDTNAVAGWEQGINLGNWLDSTLAAPTLGTFVDC